MRLYLIAVGRLRGGEEQALSEAYIARAAGLGRNLGFPEVALIEVEARAPQDPRKEAEALYRATPDAAHTILLDERGADLGSRGFAQRLARLRDDGAPSLALWIGGAEGVAQSVKDQAHEKLAFGRWTWPHRLVRVMAAEQIYRALTILSHSPYHRD